MNFVLFAEKVSDSNLDRAGWRTSEAGKTNFDRIPKKRKTTLNLSEK